MSGAFKIFVRKLIRASRIQYYKFLSDNCPEIDYSSRVQPALLTGFGEIQLGHCHIGCFPSPRYWNTHCYLEARSDTAKIVIADGVFLNNDATVIAERSLISIKEDCLIGPGIQIFDTDFHSLDPKKRMTAEHRCLPVLIERNVFIGASVTILKGVTIGRDSVIAAGAVVNTSIPPGSIAAGVPAKVVGKIFGRHNLG